MVLARIAFLFALFFSGMAYAEPPKTALTGPDILQQGKEAAFTLTLTDQAGNPLLPDDFLEVHKSKIHLLVVDDSMTDYQHIHPVAGEKAGQYNFSFKPETAHGYMIWIDITLRDNSHYYLKEPVKGTAPCTSPCINTTPALSGMAGGLVGNLSFDPKELVEGEMAMATISLIDGKGAPVKDLQPVMGAFAHIVGFYTVRPGVMHVHPMGEEPKDDNAHGGPDLMFHLSPNQPGAVKLFAQVRRDNRDIFIPFTVIIRGKNDEFPLKHQPAGQP
jgi:hypothetical protein